MILTFMDAFGEFKTLLEEVTADVMEMAGDPKLEVENCRR